MTDAYLGELLRRLGAGEDPGRVQRSLVDAPLRETLRRCAVARTFDRACFDAVLRGPGGPTVDRLVDDEYAEPVPGRGELFRLRPDVREQWLSEWAERPAELSGILADRQDDEIEELYYRAVSDPSAAAALFTRLFAEADAAFDLVRAQDLLDVLREPARLPWLSPELLLVGAERYAYLRARSFWSTEWRQSARYLERPGPAGALRRLIAEDGPRALQLHARGGSGKTMLLRWFIARWCVPEPRRIPCARIDFDQVAVPVAGRHPWLLLLELADQLNRQMPAAPFQELIDEHGELRGLLGTGPSVTGRDAADRLATEVTERFTRILAEAAGDRPVLLAFDTFEQVLLHPEGDPAAVLRVLGEVRRRCAAVRLLIAGRYSLSDRVDDVGALLPRLRSTTVERFTDKEARRYLQSRRGVHDSGLVTAIVDKSKGDPFVLALFADLAHDRIGLTPQDIRAYDNPHTLYLIERIISRVADPAVRWLLRYGVVPRRLDLAFVTGVMAGYLRSGMSGTSTVDDPAEDRLPDRAAARDLFPADLLGGPDEPLDLAAVWNDLLRYASASSWVSRRDGDRDTVTFHPDLVVPMRRLLRHHDVYRKLHEAAAHHYLRLGDNAAEAGLPWLLEAVYHRFQAGADDAEATWHRVLRTAAETMRPEEWLRVADEVLGPDYLDEDGQPLPFDDTRPMVGWDVLYGARLERARVALFLAERATAGVAREQARRALADLRLADGIRRRHDLARPDDAALLVLAATAERLAGDVDAARASTERALRSAPSGQDRATLTEGLADDVRTTEPERAARLYHDALAESPAGAYRVNVKLAAIRAGLGDFAAAVAIIDQFPLRGARTEAEALTLIEIGRVWLRAGRPADLLIRVEGPPDSVFDAAARDWCTASALLALNEPFAALAFCERQHPPGRLGLEIAELHAQINAALLRLDESYAELDSVTAGWRRLGETERSWAASGAPAGFDLRGGAGLGRHAEHLLYGSHDADRDEGGEGWFRRRLSALRSAVDNDDATTVARLGRETRAALNPRRTPGWAVQLALILLPSGDGSVVDLLLEGLNRIDSIPARLALLAPLSRCGRLPATAGQRAELIDLLGTAPRLDQPDLVLPWVEAHRALGNDRAATDQLLLACALWLTYFPAPRDHRDREYRRWLLLDAAERLGWPDLPFPPLPPNELISKVSPVLAASTLVLCALRDPAGAQAVSWLDRAQSLLARGGAAGSEWDVHVHIARALSDPDHRPQAEQSWRQLRPHRPMPYADRFSSAAPRLEPVPIHAGEELGRVRYRLDGGYVSFTVNASGAITRELTFARLGRVFQPRPEDTLATQLEPLVADLASPMSETGALTGLVFEGLPHPPHHDVTLQTSSVLLGALPWEIGSARRNSFIRVPDHRRRRSQVICALQTALHSMINSGLAVDGLAGPETWRAAREFLRLEGLPPEFDAAAWQRLVGAVAEQTYGPPTVLLVRPGTSRQLSHGRPDIDVATDYERSGYVVNHAVDAGPRRLEQAIWNVAANGRLAIVHVTGGFGITENEVHVEVADRRSPEPPGDIPVTAFDRALAKLPPELPRPLIILDPGHAAGFSETLRQLLLRNAFVHGLLELGNTPMVLGMGLDSRSSAAHIFANGGTADDAARYLRERDLPLARGVVLASHLPPYAMPRWPTR
ncbi:hypothetical protein ACQPZJ_09755 [Actinoplanes sp. CA-054009]